MFGNGKQQENEALTAKVESLETTLAEASARHMEELTRIRAEADARAVKLAARQANSILAGIGVREFAPEGFSREPAKVGQDVIDTFNSLTGIEQTEYFRAHRAELMRLLDKGVVTV